METSAHFINNNPNSSHTPCIRSATLAEQYITNSALLVAMFNQTLFRQEKQARAHSDNWRLAEHPLAQHLVTIESVNNTAVS